MAPSILLSLLRLAPLIGTTAALWFSIDIQLFLRTFEELSDRQAANAVVPAYFKASFHKGAVVGRPLYLAILVTGLANVFVQPTDAWVWYAAGAAAGFVPFAFANRLLASIKRIEDGEGKGNSVGDLDVMLRVHAIRTALGNLPMWACMLIATLKATTVVG